jgi:hypothetical protein
VTLVGAGDIARCDADNDEATAALLDRIPGTVFTLGDNAYPDGAPVDFAQCYGPGWGRHRERTRPSVGNHEYGTPGAAGYFGYFGEAAGDPARGYYAYQVGAWLIVVLNTNCSQAGCRADQEQARWLRETLAAHPSACTLAYGHHPRFSSGRHGSDVNMEPLWDVLYAHGVDIVIAAHDHHYERFALLDPHGRLDTERGLRSFVVGTGGGQLMPTTTEAPFSEVRQSTEYGVLRLTLFPDHYTWEFIPVAGGSFADTGAERCR